jgi:WXG100 family type VII secretion target
VSRIHVNYEELRAAATKLAAEAQEFEVCMTSMQQRAEQLSAAWEGVAEDEFVRQLQSCAARMTRTPAALGRLSGDVAKAADVLEAGERAAQEAIRSIVAADD